MTADADKPDVLLAFFVSIFAKKVSQAFVLRSRVQGGEYVAVD